MVWRNISGLLWQNDTKQKKETIVQTEYEDELISSESLFRSVFSPVTPSSSRGRNKHPLWWHDDTFNTHLSYKDAHIRFFLEHVALSTSTSLLLNHEISTQKHDAYTSGAMSREQECRGNEGLHWCDAMIFSRTALPLFWHCFHTLVQTLYFTATFSALVVSHYRLSPSDQTPV